MDKSYRITCNNRRKVLKFTGIQKITNRKWKLWLPKEQITLDGVNEKK